MTTLAQYERVRAALAPLPTIIPFVTSEGVMSKLFEDITTLTDHELNLTLGSVKKPNLPVRFNHPVADKFPNVSDADYAKLVGDINCNGQKRAIVLFHGRIWDGRARYSACVDLGLVPQVWILRGIDPVVYLLHHHRVRYGLHGTPERAAALEIFRAVKQTPRRGDADAAREKAEWIAEARREFKWRMRGPRNCDVCGLGAAYSHAHHSLPLDVQYDLGVGLAIDDHDWLCPVHHKLTHRLIGSRLLGTRAADEFHPALVNYLKGEHRDEMVALNRVFERCRTLFVALGGVLRERL